MKAVWEVEHHRRRAFLVTCEVPLAKHEVEAAGRKEAAIRKPKTYRAHERKGRPIRVTIPED